MSAIRLPLILSLALVPSLLSAQVRRDSARTRREADTTWMPRDMRNQMDMMAPMMSAMMSNMLHATLDVLAEPEMAQRMATFTKNYFDALVSKGFTRDEALRIVIGQGIPLPSGRN